MVLYKSCCDSDCRLQFSTTYCRTVGRKDLVVNNAGVLLNCNEGYILKAKFCGQIL